MASFLAELDLMDDENEYSQVPSTQDYSAIVENAITSIDCLNASTESGSQFTQVTNAKSIHQTDFLQESLDKIKQKQTHIMGRLKAANQKTDSARKQEIISVLKTFNRMKSDIRIALKVIQERKQMLKGMKKSESPISYQYTADKIIGLQKQLLKLLRVHKALGKYFDGFQAKRAIHNDQMISQVHSKEPSRSSDKVSYPTQSQINNLRTISLPGASQISQLFHASTSPIRRQTNSPVTSPKTPIVKDVLPGASKAYLSNVGETFMSGRISDNLKELSKTGFVTSTNNIQPKENEVQHLKSSTSSKPVVFFNEVLRAYNAKLICQDSDVSPDYSLNIGNQSYESQVYQPQYNEEYDQTTSSNPVVDQSDESKGNILLEMLNACLVVPGRNCLTIMNKGRKVSGHLLSNGYIQDSITGQVFSDPVNWVFCVRNVRYNRNTVWRLVKYCNSSITSMMGKFKVKRLTKRSCKMTEKKTDISLTSKGFQISRERLSDMLSKSQTSSPPSSHMNESANSQITLDLGNSQPLNNITNLPSAHILQKKGLNKTYSTIDTKTKVNEKPHFLVEKSEKQKFSKAYDKPYPVNEAVIPFHGAQKKINNNVNNQKGILTNDVESQGSKAFQTNITNNKSSAQKSSTNINFKATQLQEYSKQSKFSTEMQNSQNISLEQTSNNQKGSIVANNLNIARLNTNSLNKETHPQQKEVDDQENMSPIIVSSKSLAPAAQIPFPKYVVLYHDDEFIPAEKILPDNFWQDDWKVDANFLRLVNF